VGGRLSSRPSVAAASLAPSVYRHVGILLLLALTLWGLGGPPPADPPAVAAAAPSGDPAAVRVMAVGDSVTAGAPGDYAHGSYRYPLYLHYRANDVAWQPVGPYHGVTVDSLEPDVGDTAWPPDRSRHAGQGGASLGELAELVGGWTRDHQPDVVLAYPGFALDPAAITEREIERLIDEIRTARPEVRILFGLPHYGGPQTAQETEVYRTRLRRVVAERDRVASPIRLVDMNVGWSTSYHGGGGTQGRYPAEPHGNRRLAMRWADALSRYWGIGEPWPAPAAPEVTVAGDRLRWRADDRADAWDVECEGTTIATIAAQPGRAQQAELSGLGICRVRGMRTTATPDDPGTVRGAWSAPVVVTMLPAPAPAPAPAPDLEPGAVVGHLSG
jgi:hypothetical protein